jgi:hypothetical protein
MASCGSTRCLEACAGHGSHPCRGGKHLRWMHWGTASWPRWRTELGCTANNAVCREALLPTPCLHGSSGTAGMPRRDCARELAVSLRSSVARRALRAGRCCCQRVEPCGVGSTARGCHGRAKATSWTESRRGCRRRVAGGELESRRAGERESWSAGEGTSKGSPARHSTKTMRARRRPVLRAQKHGQERLRQINRRPNLPSPSPTRGGPIPFLHPIDAAPPRPARSPNTPRLRPAIWPLR